MAALPDQFSPVVDQICFSQQASILRNNLPHKMSRTTKRVIRCLHNLLLCFPVNYSSTLNAVFMKNNPEISGFIRYQGIIMTIIPTFPTIRMLAIREAKLLLHTSYAKKAEE